MMRRNLMPITTGPGRVNGRVLLLMLPETKAPPDGSFSDPLVSIFIAREL